MQVILKRTFFTPKGRFRASLTKKGPPVEIPDEYRDQLPSDAKIVGDDYVAPKVEEGPQTLSEAAKMAGLDVARVAAEQEAKIIAEADEAKAAQDAEKRLANLQKARDVKAVKAQAAKAKAFQKALKDEEQNKKN